MAIAKNRILKFLLSPNLPRSFTTTNPRLSLPNPTIFSPLQSPPLKSSSFYVPRYLSTIPLTNENLSGFSTLPNPNPTPEQLPNQEINVNETNGVTEGDSNDVAEHGAGVKRFQVLREIGELANDFTEIVLHLPSIFWRSSRFHLNYVMNKTCKKGDYVYLGSKQGTVVDIGLLYFSIIDAERHLSKIYYTDFKMNELSTKFRVQEYSYYRVHHLMNCLDRGMTKQLENDLVEFFDKYFEKGYSCRIGKYDKLVVQALLPEMNILSFEALERELDSGMRLIIESKNAAMLKDISQLEQDDAASDISVDDAQCKLNFSELKDKKNYSFIVFRIADKTKQVVVDKLGQPGDNHEQFAAALPANECRYAVYDFDFETAENGQKRTIYFMAWSPDTAKNRKIYASNEDRFKKELGGIDVELQATNLNKMIMMLLEPMLNDQN